MDVVTEVEQVAENVAELERGRTASSGTSAEEYRALIKRGTCFVPYVFSEGLAFAPSRFVGYVGNKLATHANNPDRDGRITNAALNKIIGSQPHPDASLERRYLAFCAQVEFSRLRLGLSVLPESTGLLRSPLIFWKLMPRQKLLATLRSLQPRSSNLLKPALGKACLESNYFRTGAFVASLAVSFKAFCVRHTSSRGKIAPTPNALTCTTVCFSRQTWTLYLTGA